MSEAETIRFDSLDISGEVLRAVAKMGFTAMTPVQARTMLSRKPPIRIVCPGRVSVSYTHLTLPTT